jgi:hypothetical protein
MHWAKWHQNGKWCQMVPEGCQMTIDMSHALETEWFQNGATWTQKGANLLGMDFGLEMTVNH